MPAKGLGITTTGPVTSSKLSQSSFSDNNFKQPPPSPPPAAPSPHQKPEMSSEEVAELAQAIHNHADVLYESWKKGQEEFNMKRMEDTLELLADPGLTPKLEHLVSNFVRRDKAKRQFQQTLSDSDNQGRESSPVTASKKALPKSILAVVQRFEPQPQPNLKVQEIHYHSPSPREQSPAGSEGRFIIPGFGPVSKNVLWADSINKHAASERISDRGSPVPTPVNIKNYLDGSGGGVKTVVSPSGKVVRERRIPIEREEENNCRNLSPNPSSSNIRYISPSQSQQNNEYKAALEQEENKLIKALSNQKYSSNIPPRDRISIPETQQPLSSPQSRVAFAKQRIRQSQENPMTQQRLELQKKLPCPNGNLAAAIALQQGKLKFNGHLDEADRNNSSPHKNNVGRHFGPGASVASRVQLFEKYPAASSIHLNGGGGAGGGYRNRSPTPIRSPGHVITHAIHIQSNVEARPKPQEDERLFHKSEAAHRGGGGGSEFNQSAPWRSSPGGDAVGPHLQQPSSDAINPWKNPAPAPLSLSPSHNTRPPRTALDKSNKSLGRDVPRFFWPEGKAFPNNAIQERLCHVDEKLKEMNGSVNYNKFGELLVASEIPLYWKKPFWMALYLSPEGTCTSKMFIPFLGYLLTECADDAARFVRIISTASRNFPVGHDSSSGYSNTNNNRMNIKYYTNHGTFCQDLKTVGLTMSDLVPIIQDIVDTHPGLGFLREAPEFHSRYITTVISRIFYKVNRSWSGRLTLPEIRRSNLLQIIKRLEEENDINTITEYFSYEHFYVIYCKFWELDKDHDLLIDKHDLASHADHSLSSRIIERIFSGTVLRGWDVTNPMRVSHDKMTYSDFVWFLLSEEDKTTPTAIEYWFRCLDIDGDGIISPYELEYFYSEQENRIEALGVEPLLFSNVYCQIVDMLHCSPKGLRLRDLKKNPHLASNVFNTVFNLEKYLDHEQRDPFAASAVGNVESELDSDWDKYAAAEYEVLIAEELPAEHL